MAGSRLSIDSLYSKKHLNFFLFCRFFWLSRYVSSLSFGSSIFLITLEPFIEEESLKLCFYKGILIFSSLGLNSLSVVLRQTFNGVAVERTFFLNSSNFVFVGINYLTK